ncbi:hypothetical protein [Coraliomargarita akajimensis]|uniref:Uncharacterized protein n=1 Tax=Coraliomargarita akajimensis (strain DSM 45221 / IAM 15411 / JCM 23193 / KCTC 12865 / 04OKA010-24) TaxID=583355 RepID=D5EIC5_CORAD|nr:hypothetical protein [Coraliomargarita akajimensis]ADE54191.1 hypothetical protein Caka_1170 [Coraliomargarita akajimensis DSM 45221]
MRGILEGLPEGTIAIDTFLRSEGFNCVEDESSESNRWRSYLIEVSDSTTNALLRIRLRFELTVSDGIGSYDDTHTLFYDGAFLDAYDRQMEPDGWIGGEPYFDEETELLRHVGTTRLRIESYKEFKQFIHCFS